MSLPSLSDRIRATKRSRSPVQETVERKFDQITDALAKGDSFKDIYDQLSQEGEFVGAARNSLWNAYHAVKRRRAKAGEATGIAPVAQVTPAPTVPRPSLPSQAATLPAAAERVVTGVTDTRRPTTDW